ncbi:MRG/MORF4L-binding protein-like [Corticium candelabrum]|uniref:MRG/MORF4L-binding protein-like n=1 Tax=Corticium candelabrum TaxID=121492 RepID=UPI002E264C1E|nr:MRG/MORF4L-binding protein-like [Corticium candelabrum]
MMASDEDVVWTVELETHLFHAMQGHKPVGVSKHFHMVCIQEQLCQMGWKHLSAEQIWKHLGTMYNLDALEETEPVPFPNSIIDFNLPDDLLQPAGEKEVEQEPEKEKESESESGTPTNKAAPTPTSLPASTVTPDSPKRATKRLRITTAMNSPASPAVPAGTAGKRRRQVIT